MHRDELLRAEHASLIILAGGESRRMGRVKPLIATPVGTMLDYLVHRLGPLFSEVIVAGHVKIPVPVGARWVQDRYSMRSPLVGIEAGLTAAAHERCFVIACDMPFAEPALVEHLVASARGKNAVIPVVNGYDEPLFAVYTKGALPVIRAAVAAGRLKVGAVCAKLNAARIEEDELRRFDRQLDSFINLNTPHDLVMLQHL